MAQLHSNNGMYKIMSICFPQMELQQNEISIQFELWLKNLEWNQAKGRNFLTKIYEANKMIEFILQHFNLY